MGVLVGDRDGGTMLKFGLLFRGGLDLLGGFFRLHLAKVVHSATKTIATMTITTCVVASLSFALLSPPLSAKDAALGATV